MEFSQITEDLFVGTTPRPRDYDELRSLGVTLVINMRLERWPRRDTHPSPLAFKWYPTLDNPLFPIPIFMLHRGARAALEAIEAGGKVYVHCQAGRHRSVAMAASILIAQGMDASSAMELIKSCREIADPDIWYIRRRIERFADGGDAGRTTAG